LSEICIPTLTRGKIVSIPFERVNENQGTENGDAEIMADEVGDSKFSQVALWLTVPVFAEAHSRAVFPWDATGGTPKALFPHLGRPKRSY
jgi:hypothetical protein